jgi:two-component system chemotaxis response regulator CheY
MTHPPIAPLDVLIADDSAVMRAMITRVLRLTGLPLASVRGAADGVATLDALRTARFDLLVLDVNMPQLDGEAVLDRLHADPAVHVPAVLVVSTESSAPRIARLQARGADFVHKPFTPEQLRARILARLGLAHDQPLGPVTAGDGCDF